MLNPDAPLPDHVYNRLTSRVPVLNQSVKVDATRWQQALHIRRMPMPVGKLASRGQVALTRADVFAVADQDPEPEAAIQLLWHTLAWGLGPRAQRLHARLDAIADQDGASKRLVEAWVSVRDGDDPKTSYQILTTDRGASRIRWLGPAFSTKFLYFAQGQAVAPTHLMLDNVVATNLQATAWPDAPTAGWWPITYGSYCALMQGWAAEASGRSGREVSADEIEFTVFKDRRPASARLRLALACPRDHR
jgi:hypothetical protein